MEYLTTLSVIKKNSIISSNIQDKFLISFLKRAQDNNLQSLIGRNLYKEIQDNIKNNTLSEKEIILLKDYIEDYLISLVEFNMIESQMISLNGSGIFKNNLKNTTLLSPDEFWKLLNTKKEEYILYGNLIIEYIEDENNIDDFPKYKNVEVENYIEPVVEKVFNVRYPNEYINSIYPKN